MDCKFFSSLICLTSSTCFADRGHFYRHWDGAFHSREVLYWHSGNWSHGFWEGSLVGGGLLVARVIIILLLYTLIQIFMRHPLLCQLSCLRRRHHYRRIWHKRRLRHHHQIIGITVMQLKIIIRMSLSVLLGGGWCQLRRCGNFFLKVA